MQRPIIYAQEQGRSYDFLSGFREALYALGIGIEDVLGSTDTIVAGLNATASSGLTIAVSAGRIYKLAAVDSSEYGTVGIDSRTTMQQGEADAQTLTLSTSGISSGQSQYALVQATFTQTDATPSDDPNGGILSYYNADDPEHSLVGPSGTGTLQATRRYGKCVLSIKYGTAASTGSETAPSSDSGYVPLYLIDLAYGQTTITSAQIVKHAYAPFLAGLLAAHHSGGAGQAPKIDLTSEVKNVLPLANIPSIPMTKLSAASSANSGSGIMAAYAYAGNPNGNLAGTAAVAGVSPPDTCWDVTNNILYVCISTGTASTAAWALSTQVKYPTVYAKQLTGTVSASTTLDSVSSVTLATGSYRIRFKRTVYVTEATYGIQLYYNSTAIPGAFVEVSVSTGGSDDAIKTPVSIEGFITLTETTTVSITAKYGVVSSSGSLTDVGGGGFTIEPVELITIT